MPQFLPPSAFDACPRPGSTLCCLAMFPLNSLWLCLTGGFPQCFSEVIGCKSTILHPKYLTWMAIYDSRWCKAIDCPRGGAVSSITCADKRSPLSGILFSFIIWIPIHRECMSKRILACDSLDIRMQMCQSSAVNISRTDSRNVIQWLRT